MDQIDRHCPWLPNSRPKKNSLHNLMNRHTGHYWDREGEGGKGSPYRYKALRKPDGVGSVGDGQTVSQGTVRAGE